jgi:hypothetical protein
VIGATALTFHGAARATFDADLLTAGRRVLKLAAGGPEDRWDVEQALDVGGDALLRELEPRIDELPADAQDLR